MLWKKTTELQLLKKIWLGSSSVIEIVKMKYNQFSTININKFLYWYDLNMYIINVIADDETKIGLYEIYFLND
jgi:hypothetical protein